MISAAVRARYLRDPWPVQIGGLAADLARIASFSGDSRHKRAVTSLLEEGKYFAEWSAPQAPLNIQEALCEVQLWLALKDRQWARDCKDPDFEDQARYWSNRLLQLSGLV